MNQSRACLYHNTRFIQVRCAGEQSTALLLSLSAEKILFIPQTNPWTQPELPRGETPWLCQISEKHNSSLASQMLIFQRGKCIFFKAEGSSLEFSYLVRVINVLFREQTEARSLGETSSPLCLPSSAEKNPTDKKNYPKLINVTLFSDYLSRI